MSDTPVTRRDSLDFRDKIYQPALIALPPKLIPVKKCIVIRDQGLDGACTGFGLAAMIDYINRTQGIRETVSARMLYEMAKRHDHWPGDNYEGSSARGAMKGWHKGGVCPESLWRYDQKKPGSLNKERQQAALKFPLGAYYRVLPRRSDIHTALNETGAIYVSAETHAGWSLGKRDKGVISYRPGVEKQGGHAFAIIGYTDQGFIIQNSWGTKWGGLKIGRTLFPGCALWTYEDFEANAWDIWVARLALPIGQPSALDRGGYDSVGGRSKKRAKAPPRHEISEHYIHIDDGQFDPFGDYPSLETEVKGSIERAVGTGGNSSPAHIVLYAHGGLNDVKGSASRVSAWREVFAANRIHELHLIWETGLMEELRDVLLGKQDFTKERAGASVGDWWDKIIERATHPLGHPLWKEMQADAVRAFVAKNTAAGQKDDGAGTKTLRFLIDALARLPAAKQPRLHLVGHSAGSILFAHLVERWTQLQGPAFENLILFAPACTTDLFNTMYYPALKNDVIEKLHHFHLDDQTEHDDNVAKIYRKSLLYLVSRSYQQRNTVVPIMGMAKYLAELKKTGIASRIKHYNTADHRDMTTSTSHGGFDNDLITMNTMLKLVLGKKPPTPFMAKHMKDY